MKPGAGITRALPGELDAEGLSTSGHAGVSCHVDRGEIFGVLD